jgi:hypothetical protein
MTVEIHSAIRKNEVMWFKGKWMQRPHVFSHMWETDIIKYKHYYENRLCEGQVTNGRGQVKEGS